MDSRPNVRAERSASLEEACDRFLDDLGAWIARCLAELKDAPPTDGHDQGTFMLPWTLHIVARQNDEALEFMLRQRDRIRDHFVAKDKWRHGYWRMSEAHHGTEHFELFLGALWRLRPTDADTVAQFVDAAEHFGDWSDAVEPWFDWESGLYRSMYFGADGLRLEPGMDLNVPDHFRCVSIALHAHEMTGETRYLDLARGHAGRWADAILGQEHLPVGLLAKGPVSDLSDQSDATYRRFAGAVGSLDDHVGRAENLLASGAVNALLKLWQLTQDARFRQAAERLLDVIAPQAADPDAIPAVDLLRAYTATTGDPRYLGHVREAMKGLNPFDIRELAIAPSVKRERKPHGIGKRADMPDWFEDGHPRRQTP
ncbi:MAG: hypothetical protein FJ272_04405, partial [Planctomycetes bacterium]|nr:hypothetical protein [Planctomycetota bacterium]